MADLNVLGIVGSLRAGSHNRKLMREAARLAPSCVHVDVYEAIGELPHYNAELDEDGKRGDAVESFKTKVAEADGVIYATPEYNHSIPGVLKNAIDWASRPAGKAPLNGKPSGILGASPGVLGTARAQTQLRTILYSTRSPVLAAPEILVGKVRDRLDEDGRLDDDATVDFVTSFMERFADFITLQRK